MLFNAPEFIYFFLPFSVVVWWIFQHIDRRKDAQIFVIVSSIYFYGWWDTRYVPLLVFNALSNYFLGKAISKYKSRILLMSGLVYNISLLGYFKYADFFIENWNVLSGGHNALLHQILPLGISFFTFQVIAYLVDCYKGCVTDFNLRRFAFSISFYPHLIAGPILHYSDVMPQLRQRTEFDAKKFSQGIFLFVVGLFKKSVVADRIAETIDPLFAANIALQFVESWVAAIGYGLQIYFDFSGYSDMAIGISLMFGIILPQNFNSPYQANSISDFWRRWHITLSRFLREYIYIPLGGNREGLIKGLVAAGFTMIIGGFWHGASWTFLIWGMLHGAFIAINRIWAKTGHRMPQPLAIAITFLSVTVAWVVFRAESVNQALSVWKGMVGINGLAIPGTVSWICKTCTQTTLINGMELVQFGVLLAICLDNVNAQKTAQLLEPNFKTIIYLMTLFFTSLWLSGSHESFIYWQF